MNKLISVLTVLLLSYCSPLIAQNCPNEYWGTKTLYKPQQKKYAPVPNGYQAVFINYVGRHGARHLTKDVAGTLAYSLLLKADSARALKADGGKLKEMVIALQKVEKPNLKSISLQGAEEQTSIGERMLLNNSNVFKRTSYCLNIAITKEERTKQSANAFLKGLKYTRDRAACSSPDKIDNDDLRFFSIAPAYGDFENNGSWKKPMEKLEKAVKPARFDGQFLDRFFTSGFIKKLSIDQQDEFIDDIFGFSSITNSIQKEITNAGYTKMQLDFRTLISCDELRVLDLLNSADDFLKKGPGMDNSGIQVRDAVPLLVNFINTTDDYIKRQDEAAVLRFAHAETIAPFAALLDLDGASKPAGDILQYDKVWKPSQVIPLSSNIQWIFFKDTHDNYLVKFLLNEKEVGISGLPAAQFPYYQWNDVRKYYTAKLNKLHVSLTDDMHAYLINLK